MRRTSAVSLVCAFAAALIAGGAAPSPARAADDPHVAAVIRASSEALGLRALAKVRTVHLQGKVVLAGVSGTAEGWQDVRSGMSSQYYDVGPLSGANGYDGQHAWNRDAGGVVWNDDGTSGRYGAIQGAYQARYALWSPDRGGATVTWSEKTVAGERYDVLHVTAPGTVPFEYWIDAQTHLPQSTVTTIGTTTSIATFADFHRVGGLQVPYVQTNDSAGNVSTFTVTKADVDDPHAAQAMRRPVMHVDDYALPSGSTTIPMELVDNHVDLDVTINGKGPYHFLFDTGGSNYLDSDIAKQLGIGSAGNASGSGVGTKTEAIQFATIDTLGVGDATLRKQAFVVAPVRAGFGVSSGKPVDGLIGFEVLSRFITTFDYGKNQIVLRTSAAPASSDAATLPFVFNGNNVDIPCAIGGFSGRCTIDTGSRVALTVLSPFLAAHPSLVPANAAAVGANGFGLGGPALGRLARTTLQIGPYAIPDTISDLSVQTKGAFANPYTAGNIGAATLKRFAVTFDYAKQTMTLVPNASFAQRETYDRSGTFLITQAGKVIIADVRPGTAAADAGLARGDVLTAVDGKDPATLGVAAIRDLFRGAPGTAIPLTVTPKGATAKTVTLTLRDYV